MLRAVVYCRCSTEEERQVDALKKQVAEAKACVQDMGWNLVDSYVESKSGTTVKGRLEYSRLFEDLRSDRFDIIVIKSQDRLMRNTKDWYLFLDRMQSNGKKLYLYIERKFYTTEDSLITGIKAILAEEYSRELSKKITNAHKHRQENGDKALITGRTFGFLKNLDGSVEIDMERRDALIRMYQYACHYGCRTVANLLEREGVVSKNGKSLRASDVRRIIQNPINKGIFLMNKSHFDFETKTMKKNPEEEWIYAEGLVPAIVDEELWQRANDAIASRACRGNVNGRYPKGSNPGKYMLSGKLICGMCGKAYYRSWRRTGGDPENVHVEWKCSNYVQSGRKRQNRREGMRKIKISQDHGCDNIHLEESVVYEILEQVNRTYFQTADADKTNVINQTIKMLEKALAKNNIDGKTKRLQKEKDEIQHKKQVLLEKLLNGVVSDDDYQTRNLKFETRLSELKSEETSLFQQVNEQENLKKRLLVIREKLETGGFEKAVTGQMLNYVQSIIVHEWQLEIRFDTLLMAGLSFSDEFTREHLSKQEHLVSIFADYPFSPNTEKGRYLDRLHIMEMLEQDSKLTAKKISEELKRSQHMVWNRMEELKKEGYIAFHGKGGKGSWEILKNFEDVRGESGVEKESEQPH